MNSPDISPAEPVTVGEITEFLHHLARLRSPGLAHDPAQRTALLTHKAELFARIAQQPSTNPAHAEQARQIAHHARNAAAPHNTDNHDTTNANTEMISPRTAPTWQTPQPHNPKEVTRQPSRR